MDYTSLRKRLIALDGKLVTLYPQMVLEILDELEALRAKEKPAKPPKNVYPADFEAAWNAYPSERRGTKITAHRAWLARVNAGVDPRSMADGLSKYLQHAKQTGKGVPYLYLLQTFFGPDEHFNTDWTVTAAMRKGGGGGSIGEQDYGAGVGADGSF